jgi:hypothetical protein
MPESLIRISSSNASNDSVGVPDRAAVAHEPREQAHLPLFRVWYKA